MVCWAGELPVPIGADFFWPKSLDMIHFFNYPVANLPNRK